jgi:hypothetical protein
MTQEIEPTKPMPIETRHPVPPPPIHPLAALVTIVLDNIFGVFEIFDPLALILTSVTVGVLGGVTTTMIQHYLAKDAWGPAVAKGLVMGIFAGVPFQVTGTAVGIPLLAWAGLHELIKFPLQKDQPQQIPPSDEIVDVEVKEVK